MLAAMTRTSATSVFLDPNCLYSFDCRNLRSFAWAEVTGKGVYLIEEEGSPLRLIDEASLSGIGARECALEVAEQLVLEKVCRDSSAVERYEGFALARTEVVDCPGKKLFSCSGLARYQHGCITRGHEGDFPYFRKK